jgi:hypothetical protein
MEFAKRRRSVVGWLKLKMKEKREVGSVFFFKKNRF